MKREYLKPELDIEYTFLGDAILTSFGKEPTDNDTDVGGFPW